MRKSDRKFKLIYFSKVNVFIPFQLKQTNGGVSNVIASIVNLKGGSGKSTVASLLSLALADLGKRVIIVDRDPQAGLTAMLLGDYKIDLTYEDFERPAKATLYKVYESLGSTILVPSTIDAYSWILELGYPSVDQQIVALEELMSNVKADAILIDTPPEPNPFLVAALAVSDVMLLPVDRSRSTLRGAALTLKVLALREVRGRRGPRKIMFVLNRMDLRERRAAEKIREVLTTHVVEKLSHKLDITIAETVIPRRRVIEDASALAYRYRKPMVNLYKTRHDIAEPSLELAKEVEEFAG